MRILRPSERRVTIETVKANGKRVDSASFIGEFKGAGSAEGLGGAMAVQQRASVNDIQIVRVSSSGKIGNKQTAFTGFGVTDHVRLAMLQGGGVAVVRSAPQFYLDDKYETEFARIQFRRINADDSMNPVLELLPDGDGLVVDGGLPRLSAASDGSVSVIWVSSFQPTGGALSTQLKLRTISSADVLGSIVELTANSKLVFKFGEVLALGDGKSVAVINADGKLKSIQVSASGIPGKAEVLASRTRNIDIFHSNQANGRAVIAWNKRVSSKQTKIFAIKMSKSGASKPRLVESSQRGNEATWVTVQDMAIAANGKAGVVYDIGGNLSRGGAVESVR